MAVPGCPALAFCTASMARQRMVSIESVSMSAGIRLLGIAGCETVAARRAQSTSAASRPEAAASGAARAAGRASSARQELADALLGTADDCPVPADDDGALEQGRAL